MLQAEPEFQVVGQAEHGAEAVELVKAKKPDVLIVDAAIAGTPVMQLLRELSKMASDCRVVLLNASLDRAHMLEALRVRGLSTRISGRDVRVPKFAQRFTEKYNLGRREAAVICLLLLRGPQTVGELRSRSDSMSIRACSLITGHWSLITSV